MNRFTREGLLELLDRLRRQAVDVITPVLALVAAGQITGLDLPAVAAVLVGGSIATVVGWLAVAEATVWWQRAIITVAGAFLAVAGNDWRGWIDLDPLATLAAVAGSVALAFLRTWTTLGRVGPSAP